MNSILPKLLACRSTCASRALTARVFVLCVSLNLCLAITAQAGKPTVPAAPSNLSANAVSSSQINLAWTDNSSNESGFKIQRASSPAGPWTQIATVGANVRSYASTGLSASTAYYYRVCAYNNKGDSAYANTASATTSPTVVCTYSLSATSASFAAAGGSGSVSVTTGAGCGWSAASGATWITITAGANGSGGGAVGYAVAANTSTTTRAGSMTIAGQTFTVTQAGVACTYSLSATSASFAAAGGSGSVTVTAGAGCAWSATSGATWITITAGASGNGNGTVSYSVAPNASGCALTGSMTIAGQTFTVTQAGVACSYSLSATSAAFAAAGGSSTVSVTATPCCLWTASSGASWIVINAGAGGSGNGTVYYSVAANPSTSTRAGTMTIAGQTFTVTQAAAAGDTSPPSVTLTAPTSGSTVSGTIAPAASASDNVGVARVEFYRDGTTLVGTATASPYSVADDTTRVANGLHSYCAKAYDTAGNSATSASSTVTVSNSTPTVPGQYLWARQVTNTAPGGFSVVSATAVDAAGNVIGAGFLNGTVDLGGGLVTTAGRKDVFVIKRASNGAYLWSQRIGGVSDDQANGVAVDSAGNVYVIGYFSGTVDFGCGAVTAANPAVFLLKLSAQGVPLWCKQFGGTTGINAGYAVAVDSHDAVLITGYYGYYGSGVDFGLGMLGSAGGRNIFVAKYGSDGTPLWAKGIGGGSSDMDWGTSIAVDRRDDSVLVCGNFTGSANFGGGVVSGGGAFLAKYSSTGTYVWAQGFGSASAAAVAVDPNGNIALDGSFSGSVNFGAGTLVYHGSADMFVARFTAGGGCLWSKNFGSPYGGDALYGVAADASGNVIITGSVLSGLDFGGGYLYGSGSQNVLIVKFSNGGAYVWGRRYVTTTPVDAGTSVATDQGGNVIAGGYFQTTIDFGGGAMTSATSMNNGFVLKLAP
jgi:hypothetical protein